MAPPSYCEQVEKITHAMHSKFWVLEHHCEGPVFIRFLLKLGNVLLFQTCNLQSCCFSVKTNIFVISFQDGKVCKCHPSFLKPLVLGRSQLTFCLPHLGARATRARVTDLPLQNAAGARTSFSLLPNTQICKHNWTITKWHTVLLVVWRQIR